LNRSIKTFKMYSVKYLFFDEGWYVQVSTDRFIKMDIVMVYLLYYICHGMSVMVYLSWYICHGLSVMVYLSWYICHGISVMVYLSWYICHGISAYNVVSYASNPIWYFRVHWPHWNLDKQERKIIQFNQLDEQCLVWAYILRIINWWITFIQLYFSFFCLLWSKK